MAQRASPSSTSLVSLTWGPLWLLTNGRLRQPRHVANPQRQNRGKLKKKQNWVTPTSEDDERDWCVDFDNCQLKSFAAVHSLYGSTFGLSIIRVCISCLMIWWQRWCLGGRSQWRHERSVVHLKSPSDGSEVYHVTLIMFDRSDCFVRGSYFRNPRPSEDSESISVKNVVVFFKDFEKKKRGYGTKSSTLCMIPTSVRSLLTSQKSIIFGLLTQNLVSFDELIWSTGATSEWQFEDKLRHVAEICRTPRHVEKVITRFYFRNLGYFGLTFTVGQTHTLFSSRGPWNPEVSSRLYQDAGLFTAFMRHCRELWSHRFFFEMTF